MYVHQPEPKSFKPGRVKSSKLRRKVFDGDVNYQDRRSKFYNKLIDIKNQQKETLKLLDQLSKADQELLVFTKVCMIAPFQVGSVNKVIVKGIGG